MKLLSESHLPRLGLFDSGLPARHVKVMAKLGMAILQAFRIALAVFENEGYRSVSRKKAAALPTLTAQKLERLATAKEHKAVQVDPACRLPQPY
jgi:hypothetical protein